MAEREAEYEKLGSFYLGREYQLDQGELGPNLTVYDSKDLVTHGVIVGMTGSGKTGLGVTLLEEAAIDGIPALVIDPKGDLSNLLLSFPDLQAADFEPWVNPDDAARAGQTIAERAAAQAELWRRGLADWHQSPERIRRMREAADFTIYTPGSDAGISISILSSFQAPPAAVRDDLDLFRDRIATTATSLLTLLGITADPLRSREHILLASILNDAWQQGTDLTLATLISRVQTPPIERVGVMDLESFFPAKERFEFAMMLNNLLAAPGFQTWMSGEPLDVDRLLYTSTGKPRVAIFSISHLSDSERMFFVSLLLNQILGWMRSRPGTTSLRALLYIDEIFGYMPPVAEPPSKKPLLTLMKQARAFGLGIVLATQNPVDLDYKGLSNAGTWFIGRLQTERDKARVLEGLAGVANESGERFDRERMSQVLSALKARVFWLHNVHESEPEVFQTRWALSYLTGPMTRTQIKSLMAGRKAQGGGDGASRGMSGEGQGGLHVEEHSASGRASQVAADGGTGRRNSGATGGNAGRSAGQEERSGTGRGAGSGSRSTEPAPLLPPDVPQVFLRARGTTADEPCRYEPQLLGVAQVHYVDTRKGVSADRLVRLLTTFGRGLQVVDWQSATAVVLDDDDLAAQPLGDGCDELGFGEVPAAASQPKSYGEWSKQLGEHLYRQSRYELWYSPVLEAYSQPGESERDFRIRLMDRGRELRDEAIDQLRKKYAAKIQTLEDRIRRSEQKLEVELEQAQGNKFQTAISVGATILGAVFGRKRLSASTLGQASSAARGASKLSRDSDDVRRARETLSAHHDQLTELEEEIKLAVEEIRQQYDALSQPLDRVELKPRRVDVRVIRVALAWVPTTEGGSPLVDLDSSAK